jgi:biotin carboxyl carrier protein
MAEPGASSAAANAKVLEELATLSSAAFEPAKFWPRFLDCLQELSGAKTVVLLARNTQDPQEWKRLAARPPQVTPSHELTAFNTEVPLLADACGSSGSLCRALSNPGGWAVGARLDFARAGEDSVLIAFLPKAQEPFAREALLRLQLALGVPRLFASQQSLSQVRSDLERTGSALEALLQVNDEKRFLAAALSFCNALASRHNCQRISLGWNQGNRIHLQAISRTEKFDRQMSAAQALEAAMEETYEQDDEIVWPSPEGTNLVTRDHEAYGREQKVENLCSIPLRLESEVVGVITCERQEQPFQPLELKELRLAVDVVVRRLADLQDSDRWFGARFRDAFKSNAAKLLGPERTWVKLLALTITVLLIVLILVPFDYRVEGDFVLRSEEAAYLSAPFDGYIEQVNVRPGDTVEKGAVLLSFKTAELELEESAALADMTRYRRETEKARAANALAEMRISQALTDQAQARLDLARYRMDQSQLVAPFTGAVVEGDLNERLGAPVKQADVLFKVARIDTLYVEAEIHERDVQDILRSTGGRMAFVSQPRQKYAIQVLRVEQAAVPREEANVFLVRCAVDDAPPMWWRPGMSGVCKLDAGKRSLLWILTHRTVDFLRMKLWW